MAVPASDSPAPGRCQCAGAIEQLKLTFPDLGVILLPIMLTTPSASGTFHSLTKGRLLFI
jgi:hypothetical protein